MISCTTVVGAWEKPFEADIMSIRCAKKESYTCDCLNKKHWGLMSINQRATEIQRAWKENSKRSTDYGTFVHAVMEGITLWKTGDDPINHIDAIYDDMSEKYSEDRDIVKIMGINLVNNIIDPLLFAGLPLTLKRTA